MFVAGKILYLTQLVMALMATIMRPIQRVKLIMGLSSLMLVTQNAGLLSVFKCIPAVCKSKRLAHFSPFYQLSAPPVSSAIPLNEDVHVLGRLGRSSARPTNYTCVNNSLLFVCIRHSVRF